MSEPDLHHDVGDPADPLAALLRAHAPPPLSDDGFVDRTMRAVAQADPTPAHAPRPAPLAVARALALEQRRFAAQARLWRWAMAGVAVGGLLMALAVMLSPGGLALEIPSSPTSTDVPPWLPVGMLMAVAALWYAWHEFRSD
jgi:hypothetical protein